MAADAVTSYDEVPYSTTPFYYSQPDALATAATLHGMRPAAPAGCRVLELGCGRGGNLIPMALALPESQFVGIDLSHSQVASGRAVALALGLTNIDLRAQSILDVDASFGTFDYIICHGVYSWVPEAVQEKILAICRANLRSQGVAYVSYNTYPGWHLRGVLRDLLGFHLRHATGARPRLEQARAFLDFLAPVLDGAPSVYGRLLDEEVAKLREETDAYLFHEFLEDDNQPLYFRAFAARAAAADLQYLAEAQAGPLPTRLAGRLAGALERIAPDLIEREEYEDFLIGRSFRRTLLCHAGVPLGRPPDPRTVTRLHLVTRLKPKQPVGATPAGGAEEFVTAKGVSMSTDNPFLRAALHHLFGAWPRSISFSDLWAAARERAAEVGAVPDGRGLLLLAEPLLQCFLADLVELHVHPPRFAPKAGERPLASPLARYQAAAGERITNLRHYTTDVDDLGRLLLPSLDGSRDRAALCEVLAGLIAEGVLVVEVARGQCADARSLGETLNACLERLASGALLLG
jgi:SAM-dependent methyltransferase